MGDSIYWQKTDKITFKKNQLIKDTLRNLISSSGKFELLNEYISGNMSIRIDKEHRFFYTISEDRIRIISSGCHY